MKNHFFAGLLVAGILAAPALAQMPDSYLDVYIAKVKMGKRVEFDAINKRMVEINRKNKGDNWLAYETMYGESNTVYFSSTRMNYGGVEEGVKAFEGALVKVLGTAGAHKISADFDATVDSERGELRRRRWDLSANAPADVAAYNKLIGQARFIRTAIIRVRPGRVLDYEAQLKVGKAAQERSNPGVPVLVSQGVAGQQPGVFYVSTLVKSLADLDRIKTVQEVYGQGYANYMKVVAETVLGIDVIIGRFVPEISNVPDEIAAVDPKFWRPAPPPPAPAKTAEAKK